MSSLFRRKSGTWAIQYTLNGKRSTISLGRANRDVRRESQSMLDTLLDCRKYGQEPPAKVIAWLSRIDADIRKTLESSGVIQPEVADTVGHSNVKALCTLFEERGIGDWAPSTLRSYRGSIEHINAYFGDRAAGSVTEGCVDEFITWCQAKGMEKGTIKRICAVARQVFGIALRKKLITSNPFAETKIRVAKKDDRRLFVSQELYAAVAEKLAKNSSNARMNRELVALLALLRYGGLRLNEPRELKWVSMIDFKNKLVKVYAPKTDSYRAVPMFPEMRGPLVDLWNHSPGDQEYAFPIMRSRNPGWFYSKTERALSQLGVTFPRFPQNCRVSRSTEIMRLFGAGYESQWIGHTQKVAMEHYQSIEPTILDRATTDLTEPEQAPSPSRSIDSLE